MKYNGTKEWWGYCTTRAGRLNTTLLEVNSNSHLHNAGHAFKEFKENFCYQMDISTVVEEQKNICMC